MPLAGGDPILLDLDHVSLGHPPWDLAPLAADYTDFARITDADYRLPSSYLAHWTAPG
ncbi:hypothetical protein GCM10027360_93960 [Amycolatopsis echigonensis]